VSPIGRKVEDFQRNLGDFKDSGKVSANRIGALKKIPWRIKCSFCARCRRKQKPVLGSLGGNAQAKQAECLKKSDPKSENLFLFDHGWWRLIQSVSARQMRLCTLVITLTDRQKLKNTNNHRFKVATMDFF
jgi:hypothetical protein